MNSGLRLQDVEKVFQSGPSESGVRGVSFEIKAGEGFSILGPSGCGKTTTLRMIGGFEKPDRGRVFHNEKDITELTPQQRDIRTVFQKYALFPHLSVFDNVVFGLRMQKRPRAEILERAEQILNLIEISHLADRRIQQLSGGEQQRVAVARALITHPSILLLDEPLSALDLKLRERMQLELLSLRKKLGMTFIFVTHDQTEAMVLSDRIAVMNKGRLEQVGSPEEIYSRPATRFVASFIGQANFVGQDQISLLKGDLAKLPAMSNGSEWMIRPENLIARRKGTRLAADYVYLPGRITEMAFLGQNRLAKAVDAAGRQHLVKFSSLEAMPVAEKDEILLGWKPENAWTVDS